MDAFAELAASIRRVFPASRLETISSERVTTIQQAYPDVPADYLEFLQCVGWGSLGDGNFMIYNGLVAPDDIFDPITAAELPGFFAAG